MNNFNNNNFSVLRQDNLYYLVCFAGGLGGWLMASLFGAQHGCNLGVYVIGICAYSLKLICKCLIDPCLQTQKVSLSFLSAAELHSCIEMLPSGPKWMRKDLALGFPTKSAINLYYQDPIECIKLLMQNPLFASVMEFDPYKLYTTVLQNNCIFTEWLTGDTASTLQVIYCASLFILYSLLKQGSITSWWHTLWYYTFLRQN